MKQIRADGSQDKPQSQQQPSDTSEMQGFVDLGMKQEALRLARRLLKKTVMTAKTFNDALEGILMFADKRQTWTQLVESAYERLPKCDRLSVRFRIMSFRGDHNNHQGVLELMPKRIKGQVTLSELPYLMDAAFALDKKDLAKRLAKHLPQAASETNDGMMQSRLLHCWAEFLARSGNWDEAIRYWEVVQLNETLSRNAVIGIVELHAARALLAVRQGFRLRACLKIPGESCLRIKGAMARRDEGGYPQRSLTEEQRSQHVFGPQTLRAVGLLSVAGVGSALTARSGDALASPPWPPPKSLAAGPHAIFRQALSEHFTQNYDPASEMILPGNDKAIQDDAAKEFRRLQKLLEKIVPAERQKEFGID